MPNTGIVHTEYLKNDNNINSNHYVTTLQKLSTRLMHVNLGKHNSSYDNAPDGEVQTAVYTWLWPKTSDFFLNRMQQLIQCWHLCVDRYGGYVEK